VTINSAWATNGNFATISLVGSTDQTLTGTGVMSYINIAKTGGKCITSFHYFAGQQRNLERNIIRIVENTGGEVKVVGPVYFMPIRVSMDDLEIAAGASNGQVQLNNDVNVNHDFTLTSTVYLYGGHSIKVTQDVTLNSAWAGNGNIATISLVGSTTRP